MDTPTPPLGCSRDEFLAFINSLEEGERVIEAGVSGMQWETGVTVLSKHGNGMCVRWDTKFREGTGMVTSITGGTRRLSDFPEREAKFKEAQRKRAQANENYDPNLPPEGQIGRCAEFHQDDDCDCGAKCDLWKTLQHDGEKFYWYLEWICHANYMHTTDRIEPFEG